MPMKQDAVIQKYIKKYGRKGAADALNFLGKNKEFIEAISTDLGQEIMSMHIDIAEESFNKLRLLLSDVKDIGKLDVKTIEAQVEYNVCLKIIRKVQEKINKYRQYEACQ